MVHISEIIPQAEQDDDTYALLPDEMYDSSISSSSLNSGNERGHSGSLQEHISSHSGTGNQNIFEFKILKKKKKKLRVLLEKYHRPGDIFSTNLPRKPALVTLMKIEVGYKK